MPKRKTGAQLERALTALAKAHAAEREKEREAQEQQLADLRECLRTARQECTALGQAVGEHRKAIDDLKQRLQRAEDDNNRMRGYIDRVQEDDVAREELVTIGDPHGQQQLVPKRKPKQFTTPNEDRRDTALETIYPTWRRESEQRKHWVTY